jgi:hypothetical protein
MTATVDTVAMLTAAHRPPTRHRRHTRPHWARRAAFWTAVGFVAVTFLLGLVGWAALLTAVF